MKSVDCVHTWMCLADVVTERNTFVFFSKMAVAIKFLVLLVVSIVQVWDIICRIVSSIFQNWSIFTIITLPYTRQIDEMFAMYVENKCICSPCPIINCCEILKSIGKLGSIPADEQSNSTHIIAIQPPEQNCPGCKQCSIARCALGSCTVVNAIDIWSYQGIVIIRIRSMNKTIFIIIYYNLSVIWILILYIIFFSSS